jgi:hypothetical protein
MTWKLVRKVHLDDQEWDGRILLRCLWDVYDIASGSGVLSGFRFRDVKTLASAGSVLGNHGDWFDRDLFVKKLT